MKPNIKNSFYGGADKRLSEIKIVSDKPLPVKPKIAKENQFKKKSKYIL